MRKGVKIFGNFSVCKTQKYARKPKKKKSGQIFLKLSCRTYIKLLGVKEQLFFVEHITFSARSETL